VGHGTAAWRGGRPSPISSPAARPETKVSTESQRVWAGGEASQERPSGFGRVHSRRGLLSTVSQGKGIAERFLSWLTGKIGPLAGAPRVVPALRRGTVPRSSDAAGGARDKITCQNPPPPHPTPPKFGRGRIIVLRAASKFGFSSLQSVDAQPTNARSGPGRDRESLFLRRPTGLGACGWGNENSLVFGAHYVHKSLSSPNDRARNSAEATMSGLDSPGHVN